MQRHIKQYLDEDWLDKLHKSGSFKDTDCAYHYTMLYNLNLKDALEKVQDIHCYHTEQYQRNILLDNDFEYIDGDANYSVYYKTGRLITQIRNRLAMTYQYKGNRIPKVLSNSVSFKKRNNIAADSVLVSTGLMSICNYMEEDGEFIEPWDTDIFNKDLLLFIMEVIQYLPCNYADRLLHE